MDYCGGKKAQEEKVRRMSKELQQFISLNKAFYLLTFSEL